MNLALLEDILPTLIHSLCPETTIRTFVALKEFVITQLLGEKNLQIKIKFKFLIYNFNNHEVYSSKSVMHKRSFDISSNTMSNTTREQHNLLVEEWNPVGSLIIQTDLSIRYASV